MPVHPNKIMWARALLWRIADYSVDISRNFRLESGTSVINNSRKKSSSYVSGQCARKPPHELLNGLPLFNHQFVCDVVFVDIADVLDGHLPHTLSDK